ncbi:hypothetical protein [Psychroserpens damuponensis]|uniref:hypothetical protein n=1 Tax=Psychroserpens damuponensis TaxID=943936 RepID=UPI00058F3DF1|nr:hypothetical protein [Psychroserpens damuponensis]
MNENADKHLDHLSRKVMGKSAVESPSFDFTNRVMSQITSLSTSSATTYVPLISKTVWGLIIVLFVALTVFLGFVTSHRQTTHEKSSWLDRLALESISNYEFINPLAHLHLSQTTLYGIVLFAFMFSIQIPVLKHYFNKRFEV